MSQTMFLQSFVSPEDFAYKQTEKILFCVMSALNDNKK